jgi:hydrogenase-4 component B
VSGAPGVFVDPASWLHLDWVLLVVVAWLLIGVAGIFALRRLALGGQGAVSYRRRIRLAAVRRCPEFAHESPEVAVLPIGLPSLPFHFRLDSLSAFFLLIIGGVSAGVSAFAAGYFARAKARRPVCWRSNTTFFSPAWRWWFSPTTPTRSW